LASLALGSPFAALWRPPSPLRGAVVEPACLTVGGSNSDRSADWVVERFSYQKSMAPRDGYKTREFIGFYRARTDLRKKYPLNYPPTVGGLLVV
jgi:hypothetical protein